jgi:hypothetical protein
VVGVQLLPATEFFEGHHEPGKLHAPSVRQTESPEQDGLFGITGNPLDLKLFPILRFGPDMQGFDDFAAKLGQGRREHAVRRSGTAASMLGHINLFRELRGLTIHVEQLHGSRKNDDPRSCPLVGKRFCGVGNRQWIAHARGESVNVTGYGENTNLASILDSSVDST